MTRADRIYALSILVGFTVLGGLLSLCFGNPYWWVFALTCFVLVWITPVLRAILESLVEDRQFPRATRKEWLQVTLWPIVLLLGKQDD